MTGMFSFCYELEYLDLTNFDTSNVKNMSYMFKGCFKLKEIKGLNKFITEKVIDMKEMFSSCYNLEYLDISNFYVSDHINKNGMFDGCTSLKMIKGLDKFLTKFELLKNVKEKGDQRFKEKDYKGARKKWDEAIEFFDQYVIKNEKNEKEIYELYLVMLSNLCIVCNKLEDYNAVIKYAYLAFKISIKLPKILPKLYYNRAVAYAQTSKIQNAELDIKALEELLSDKEKEKAGIDYIKNLVKNKKEEIDKQIRKYSKALLFQGSYKKEIPEKSEEKPKDI